MAKIERLEWTERRGNELFSIIAEREGPEKPWQFSERSSWDIKWAETGPREIPPRVLRETRQQRQRGQEVKRLDFRALNRTQEARARTALRQGRDMPKPRTAPKRGFR